MTPSTEEPKEGRLREFGTDKGEEKKLAGVIYGWPLVETVTSGDVKCLWPRRRFYGR